MGGDWAGAVKPAAAATAAVARRARLEGAGPVSHHRSRNEGAAGRCRSRASRPGSPRLLTARCEPTVRFPGPDHEPNFIMRPGRPHHLTSGGWTPPAPKFLLHEDEGSEGRGHSVRRRLAAKALTGHRPPRPA